MITKTEKLTVKQAAAIASVSKQLIYKLVENRKLRACRIGATIRIDAEDLARIIRWNRDEEEGGEQ